MEALERRLKRRLAGASTPSNCSPAFYALLLSSSTTITTATIHTMTM